MAEEKLVTAEQIVRIVRRREQRRGRSPWVDLLGEEIPTGAYTKKEMLEILREKLRSRGDRGIGNAIKSLVLEPRNPFEPNKRWLPKREVVAVGSLIAMFLGTLGWFNFMGS